MRKTQISLIIDNETKIDNVEAEIGINFVQKHWYGQITFDVYKTNNDLINKIISAVDTVKIRILNTNDEADILIHEKYPISDGKLIIHFLGSGTPPTL